MARQLASAFVFSAGVVLAATAAAPVVAHPLEHPKTLAERYPASVVYQGALYPAAPRSALPVQGDPIAAGQLGAPVMPVVPHSTGLLCCLTVPPLALVAWRRRQRLRVTFFPDDEPEEAPILIPTPAPQENRVMSSTAAPRTVPNPFGQARIAMVEEAAEDQVIASMTAAEERLSRDLAEQKGWFRRLDAYLKRWEKARDEDKQTLTRLDERTSALAAAVHYHEGKLNTVGSQLEGLSKEVANERRHMDRKLENYLVLQSRENDKLQQQLRERMDSELADMRSLLEQLRGDMANAVTQTLAQVEKSSNRAADDTNRQAIGQMTRILVAQRQQIEGLAAENQQLKARVHQVVEVLNKMAVQGGRGAALGRV